MATEDKKIIFQIEVEQSKSITQLVSLKDRVKQLKEEQKQLNLTTIEGRKANEAYNAQIKALTKEQKSLELAIEKTAASFEFEAGSIAHNRAELSRLTAEYKNLANPTKEQTQRIKDLSDRLKEQESAIGNNTRNVGNYKDAILQISGSTGLFGNQIGLLQQGFGGLKGALSTVAGGFKTLRGAIISTGIGALIVALISLIQYFTSTDTGATKLAGIMGGLGAIVRQITGFFAELGDMLFSVADGTTSLGDALEGIGEAIIENIVNRFTAVIVILESIKDAFSELSENGLDGDFTPALKKAADGVIQLNTGIAGATDKLSAFASEIAAAAQAAYDYAVALDDIDDRQRDLNVTNAKANQLVVQLIKSAANKTKTDEERIKLLQNANSIEEESVSKQIALDKERLALVESRNKRELQAINQRNAALVEELNNAETSATRRLEIQTKLIAISDDLAQEEADIRKKIIDEETGFIELRYKNLNKIDALQEAINERERKASEDRKKRLDELYQAEVELGNARISNQIRVLDIELQNTKLSGDERIELLKKRAQLELELEASVLELKLQNEQLNEFQRQQLIEESSVRQQEIENNLQLQLAAIKEKARLEEEKKDKEQLEKRRKNLDTFASTTATLFSSINKILQEDSEAQLQKIDEQRKEELKKVGDNKEAQARINAKFDKKAEQERKRLAKRAIAVQQIQAIVNVATAVTQALASLPFPANLVAAVTTGAAGAIELGVLESQKSRLAKGGLVNGPLHTSGGVTGTGAFNNVEVEGGEFVSSRATTKRFYPILSALNEIGNKGMRPAIPRGTAMMYASGGVLDGGFAARNSSGSVQQQIQTQNELMRLIEAIPNPVVGITDIENARNKNVIVRNRANI